MSNPQTVKLIRTETSTSDQLRNEQPSETADSCDSHKTDIVRHPIVRSSWNYLKWFIWAAISGLFSCGVSVIKAAFDYRHPSENSTVPTRNCEAPVIPSPTHVELTTDEKAPSYTELSRDTLPVECSDSTKNIVKDSEPIVSETCLIHSPINSLLQVQPQESLSSFSVPNWYTEDTFADGVLPADHTEISPAPSTSFTLLNSFYADSLKGVIDETTRDQFVNQVLRSVIPRNLSDSSEVSVTPAIRKMYAWTHQDNKETEQSIIKHSSDNHSSDSDLQFAYPGKLTMSDTSFSPLSPGTAESNTPTGDMSQTPSDFGLPNIDRQDHTLAWAMSNLHVNDNFRSAMEPSDLPEPCIFSDHSPLPIVVREHQSRERSPVTTINSARLADTLSLPTFVPFEGGQMFDKITDDEVAFEQPKPKRSSSLKTQRTPPGTPGQKAVRFADAFGLDLATVRHVFDLENPPKIPASATFDLQLDTDECIAKLGAKQFGLCFAQPGAASNFIRRVLNETVCLEDCHVDMPRGVLTGTIRVKSLGYEKHIYVRITYNNWVTFFDTHASYVQGSHDGATDRFSFSVVFPDTMVPGDRAQFAIRYETPTGQQFWDNNHGLNYSVTCYAKATDLAGDGSWVHYL